MAVLSRSKISPDEARSLRAGDLRGDVLQKVASTAPASWDAGTRSARFVMSSEAVDRYGDIVKIGGMNIAEFAKNPQAFVNHNSSSWPIGSWVGLQKYLHAAPRD
jgi:hypothetical protein